MGSPDISELGFHWNTELLMGQILMDALECPDDGEFRHAFLYRIKSEELWGRIQSHVPEIRALAQKASEP